MHCKSGIGHSVGKSCGQLKKRFRLISSKMTWSGPVSHYERMDKEAAKNRLSEVVEDKMYKENNNLKDVNSKKQKEKRSWKRFRHIALMTCRYIGMGAADMSPATVYSAPDYNIDPKYWDKSFSPSYKQPFNIGPHCTNYMMFMTAW